MNNKMAVIGWGSLVWCPRNLKVSSDIWEPDGPKLPIEFARVSSNKRSTDKRVTLVIYPEYLPDTKKWVTCCWNYLNVELIEDARENLKEREGCTTLRPIGFINGEKSNSKNPDIEILIRNWAKEKGITGVVWTDLGSNKSLDEIIPHLKALKPEEFIKAKEYILKTPEQIITPLRGSLENFLFT